MKKNTVIFILILVAALFIFTVLIFLGRALPKKGVVPIPLPTTTLTPKPTLYPTATTGKQIEQTNPPVRYDKEKSNVLLEKVQNRALLSSGDTEVKNRLVSPLLNKTKVLFSSSDIAIKYVPAPDLFQVEILTSNVSSSKTEAISWFKGQGFSIEGVCNLPVMFYLSANAAEELRGSNTLFNPLSEGCL